jgi:putative transposase
MGLVSLREEVRWLREHYVASQQRACGLMQIAVSSFRYESRRSDEALRERLVAAAREQPRWGYRRLEILVRESGMRVNHKRIFRVYRELGLTVKRRKRKRLVRMSSPRVPLTAANQAAYARQLAASAGSVPVPGTTPPDAAPQRTDSPHANFV